MKNYKASFLVAILWFLIVTTLLCIPGTKLPKISWQNKIWLDKWVHIFLFSLLVFLWCRAYSKKGSFNVKKTFGVVAILAAVYGIAMEIVQHYFIPFRSFDVGDIIADAIGAMIGYWFAAKRILTIKKERI